MQIQDNIKNSITSIFANKLRSVLTMLGVIIGIISVVIVVSLGKSGQEYVSSKMDGLGVNLIYILWDGNDKNSNDGDSGRLDIDDTYVISHIPNVVSTAPVIQYFDWIFYNNKENRVNITGTNTQYQKLQNVNLLQGRFFNLNEIENSTKVCLIPQSLATALFDKENPVGKSIKLNGLDFTIIGVYELGVSIVSVNDVNIIIPLSVMKFIRPDDKLDMIYAKVGTVDNMAIVKQKIKTILEQKHNRTNVYSLMSFESLRQTSSEIISTLTTVFALIAGISLLVGGIGIMNIMLVSVTERTKEIGIRMSVGATRKDILSQFLIEAMSVSLIGGFIGIIMSFALLALIRVLSHYPIIVSGEAVFVAFFISLIIGLIFGLYPANKASSLNPVEALRYE